MNTLDPALEFILDRARATKAVMEQLGVPPYNWSWAGISAGNFGNQISGVDVQVEKLADAETATTAAATAWDLALESLLADVALGIRLGRVQFKEQPLKFRQFEGLRSNGTGRDLRYRQALEFESSWERADAAWIFKPTVTLASFKTRRLALITKEETHVVATKNEQHERALLHSLASQVNDISVDWYETATATFAEDSVPGQLVRTIPTTYDPNRPPSELVITEHMSPAPNQVHLVWRASRGQRYYISAQAPGSPIFELILDGVTDTEWMGQGMAAGLWKFRGHASNQFGDGAESDIVELQVPAVAAAA